MSVSILVPIEKLKTILPSKRMKPYRITPWHSIIAITAYKYNETDLGPYNEVSIGVPISIDNETPLFTGILRKPPESLIIYPYHLPVTTEIAWEVGSEFAGYPKFIAEIEFVEEGDWITCELKIDNQDILSLRGKKIRTKKFPRICVHPITVRNGYMLRSELVISERDMGESKKGKDVKLELGEHKIAEELKGLNLGKTLSYRYCPMAQGILTPVFESFSV
ncbi:MAG: acetoacetate decarboxylase family protein [Deltaproteobacteria bacterium]|nr:acetoacetate decarboxylase family protein [Deltaproteobacteria bacterium]